MSITRTPDVEPGTDFQVEVPIVKSYVDEKTGKRHIIGVASGVREDRDGERASVNCIKTMVGDVVAGGVKLTGSHQQDWMTEIGDVVKAAHNPETDEFEIDSVLPPEGVDPIADKAWKTANKERVGFSIGGKLLRSYYERNEVGKKRKVLDAIKLRHVALTKNPSYADSFASCVAKTWEGEAPADEEFTLEVDLDVEKAASGSWVSGSSESGGGNVGRDSVGSGKRNAGTRDPKTKGMRTDDEDASEDDSDTDADGGEDLPKAADERHLACPNCGHEFAADLPVDPEDRQVDDTHDNDDQDDAEDTGKSTTETSFMSQLTDTLDALKGLVSDSDVAKTETDPAAPAETVAKTDTAPEVTDVEKMVAASHKANSDRLDTIEKGVGEGFELVAKSLQKIQAQIAELPQGRKSTAVTRQPTVGHGETTVEKTVGEAIDEAPDALSALKIANAAAGWTR